MTRQVKGDLLIQVTA